MQKWEDYSLLSPFLSLHKIYFRKWFIVFEIFVYTVPFIYKFIFTRVPAWHHTVFVCNLLNSFVEILLSTNGMSMNHVIFTRHDILMRQNLRSISHANVILSTIRDPSSLAIGFCSTYLFAQPSISFSAGLGANNVASCHVHMYLFIMGLIATVQSHTSGKNRYKY